MKSINKISCKICSFQRFICAFILSGASKKCDTYTLVQYLFKKTEHVVHCIKPHGNRKGKESYRRLQHSTRDQLKKSSLSKSQTPKVALDNIYCKVGDVTGARSHGQLPRGLGDLYNARHAAKKEKEKELLNVKTRPIQGNDAPEDEKGVSLDSMWMLLERAKREEECSKEGSFIRKCSIHPDFIVVLANDRQLKEIGQFCTNTKEFCVLGIDPTFNVFKENISLTVTSYRNLRLECKATGQPPVFLGPMMLHQKKDWRTYSKFAYHLVNTKPELESVLACGTDGETALIDGFSRNFRYAVYLRCFIHVKDNIKRELTLRGIKADDKRRIMDEIFGKTDGSIKYCGLVDCDSEAEFRSKLEQLRSSWDERENLEGKRQSFHEWFSKEKVRSLSNSMTDLSAT